MCGRCQSLESNVSVRVEKKKKAKRRSHTFWLARMNESRVFTLDMNPAEVGHTTTLMLRLGGGACAFADARAVSSSDSNGDGGGLPPVAGVGTDRGSSFGLSGHVLTGNGFVYVVE